MIFSIRYYLSERFRLRFEDAGLDEMLEEGAQPGGIPATTTTGGEAEDTVQRADEAHASSTPVTTDRLDEPFHEAGVIRTLDGEEAGDEFAQDALNYQILLGKIDTLLEDLRLDA